MLHTLGVPAMSDLAHVPLALAAVTHDALPLQFTILFVALIASAISSASETALTSVNRIRIKNLAEDGDARAIQIERLLEKPNVFLTTILVVNNVAVILASSMATVIALSLSPQWGEVLATTIISLVVLIFCEVTPKNAAVQNAEAWARGLIPLISGLAWLLRPVIALLNGITAALLRLFGISQHRTGPSVTEEELRLMVNVGEEEGVVEEGERTMIHHIFELSETTVREVMVPRIDMVSLEGEATLSEAVDIINQVGFSRIPVYEETIDNIIGVLYAKDVLPLLRGGVMDRAVREIVRPAYFVPESKKLDDLLHELQNQHVHMALVIDEYGSVSGLVTIEDLVEEIIGDIQDEYDREEREYEQISPMEYIINGQMNLDDFNELTGMELEGGEEYDTVGGFMLAQLDKIPVVGDVVRTEDVTLTVLALHGRRISKIQAVLARPGDTSVRPPAPPTVAAGDQNATTDLLDQEENAPNPAADAESAIAEAPPDRDRANTPPTAFPVAPFPPPRPAAKPPTPRADAPGVAASPTRDFARAHSPRRRARHR
jgi:putative hemolysin